MFLSQHQIASSLKALEAVDPFFGIDFLVCKKEKLPIGKTIRFKINHKVGNFLKEHYTPNPDSIWIFRPFRTSEKNKYWLRLDYAWKGATGRAKTGIFGPAFIHDRGTDNWGWKTNYIAILKERLYHSQPLPAFHLAVWLFRAKNWSSETTPQEIIETFWNEFNINEAEQTELFNIPSPEFFDGEPFLQQKPVLWQELSEKLNIPFPPDISKDEGGTLSVLTIEGVGPAKKLHLELAERVNLFTGDNGLGKSFILECAWWALSGNWTGFPAYPREDATRDEPKIYFQIEGATGKANKGESSYDWEKQEWSSLEERPAIPGLLIYARIDGAFAVWDPARDYWTGSVKTKISKPLIFTRDEIWNGLQDNVGGNVTFLSNGLISDWILWQNSPEKELFNTFKRVLKRLSPPGLEKRDLGILEPGKPTRISGDSRWMPTIKHSYGEIPLVYASAGVRRIVALAYLIVWAWEEHKSQSKLIRKPPQRKMVILVDEIEAHLHPQWQRKILAALLEVQRDLAPELSMQLLIATHSPLLMSSVEPIFDGTKDKIFHLNLTKHELSSAEVTLQEPEFVKYGTVDSWLKSEIFELSQPRSLEAEKAMEDAKNLQSKEVVEPSEVREVSKRLVKYLSSHDGFWPRWTFFAEEHGVEL